MIALRNLKFTIFVMMHTKFGMFMREIKLLFLSIAQSKLLVKLLYRMPDKVLIKK